MELSDVYLAAAKFRVNRMQKFAEVFRPTQETEILDVGGFPEFWSGAPFQAKITILRMDDYKIPVEFSDTFRFVRGDGTNLAFPNNHFDIVFSNSVIEHVGSEAKQIAFADETRRVGRSYWVQTPAWEFPVEPHCLTPFIHWLPEKIRQACIPRFTIWKMIAKGQSNEDVNDLREVRLLNRSWLKMLFKDGNLITERFLMWPKSFVVYRRAVNLQADVNG